MALNYQYGGKDLVLLQYLEARIAKDPASVFFAMLAHFYLDAGKVAEALSIAQRGVIAHPNYSTGHTVLAMAMMRAGFYRDARKELIKASDLHPGSRMIESLMEEVDRQEQADSIGRRIAEQYRKNAGKDIMKTVEETLRSNTIKAQDEDLLIPGLEYIIGADFSRVPAIPKVPVPDEQSDAPPRAEEDKRSPESSDLKSAREIIDRVARELEGDRESEVDVPDEARSSDEVEKESGELDLDVLARELDMAGPIKPAGGKEQEHRDEEGIELTPEIVTDTLAMIFEQQGQIGTAIEAYKILLKKKPGQADFYKRKIADLESRSNADN